MKRIGVSNEAATGIEEAKSVAYRHSENYLEDPMMLSWFDWKRFQGYPNIEFCGGQEECEPGWLVYGETRGGEVRVDVGEDYSFIFAEGFKVSPPNRG